jgi:cell division protease FtsH
MRSTPAFAPSRRNCATACCFAPIPHTITSRGVTTGASNDIERATDIARNMVTKWGLSDRLGPQTYSEDDGEVFLGRSVTQHKQISDDTAHTIDEEIRKIIDSNYKRSDRILKENIDKLHAMAKALMKYETIDDVQVKNIMEGRDSGAPKDWDDSLEPDIPDGGSATEESGAAPGKIGGPAQEH